MPAVALSALLHGVALAFALEAATRRAPIPEPEPLRVQLLAATEDRPGLAIGPPPPAALPAPPPAAAAPDPEPRRAEPSPARPVRPRPPSARPAPAAAEPAPAGPLVPAAEGAPQPSVEIAAAVPSALPGATATVRRVFGEGEVDGAASPARRVKPRYPRKARALGRESDVGLEIRVEADGSVSDVTLVASGGDEFDREALKAVRRERWRPARLAGAAVPSRVRFTVRFRLDE